MGQEHTKKSNLKHLGYIGLIVVCVAYLLNPTGGFVELLPDALPFIGNLDEATITALLVLSIQKLREQPENLGSHKPHELPED